MLQHSLRKALSSPVSGHTSPMPGVGFVVLVLFFYRIKVA